MDEEPVGASSDRAWPSHMRMEWVKNTSGEEQVWNEGHMELIAEMSQTRRAAPVSTLGNRAGERAGVAAGSRTSEGPLLREAGC